MTVHGGVHKGPDEERGSLHRSRRFVKDSQNSKSQRERDSRHTKGDINCVNPRGVRKRTPETPI